MKSRTQLAALSLENRLTPTQLLNTVTPDPTGPQLGAEFGGAVAIGASMRVVGAPKTDINGLANVGQAFVYDAANTLIATLNNPSPVIDDYFGYSVAIGGNYIAVGEFRNGADGVVHVYDAASGSFPSVAFTLSNPTSVSDDDFGFAIAISGKHLVVGAHAAASLSKALIYDLSKVSNVPLYTFDDPTSSSLGNYGRSVAIAGNIVVIGDDLGDVGGSNTGSAYVYDLDVATPSTPIYTLVNPTPAGNDGFGCSVAVSNSTVIVGANADDTSAADAGAIYRYNLSGPAPTVPNLTITSPSSSPANDRFGHSLSLDGNTLAVGVAGESRSAYLFNLAGGSPGAPTLTVTDPYITTGDEFGRAVAVFGNLLVVGAPNMAPPFDLFTSPGTAFVYDKTGLFPNIPIAELENRTPSTQDAFGTSVALSSKYLVVGAPLDSANGFQSGSAYFYDVTSATPTTPIARVDSFAPTDDEQFGFAVAQSGNLALVGVPNYDDGGNVDSGRAYLYDLTSATPGAATKTFNNPSPGFNEFFGYALAMEGNIVVIAAPRNLVGISTFAGSVFVYDLNSLTPTVPVFTLDNPTPSSNERFGDAVAISGTRIIVGAPHNVVAGIGDIGSAYVYDLSGPTPTTPIHVFDNPSPNVDDAFGQSVAIAAQKVLIGAPYEQTGMTFPEPGAAYLFDLAIPVPSVPVYTWLNPQIETGHRFGIAVALTSSYAAVGIGSTATDESMAVVYEVATGKVLHNLRDTNGGSITPTALAISGNAIAVGVGVSSLQNTRQGAALRYEIGGTLAATSTTDGVTVTDAAGLPNDIKIYDRGDAVEISDANQQFLGAPLGTTLSADGKTLIVPHSLYKISVDTTGGNDTVTIATSAAPFFGLQFELKGGGGTNLLRVTGAPELIQANLDVPTKGTLSIFENLGYGTFDFTAMQSVVFDSDSTDIEFYLPTLAASTAILEDDGTLANSRSQLRSATNLFQTIVFSDTTSVALFRGKAADTVTIESMPDYNGDLTIGEITKSFSAIEIINKLKLANGDLELYGVDVSLANSNAKVTTSSGTVRLSGTTVHLAAGSSIVATAAHINGDTITLDPTASIAVQSASFGSRLGNRQIDLGGTDSATSVGLSDAELDAVSAAALSLSGTDIFVTSKITRSMPTNIQLVAVNDIIINGAIITSGTLKLIPDSNQDKVGSVQPTAAGVDVTATTTEFSSGSNFRSDIGGSVVDLQYTQLKAVGTVNLAGADLVLVGSYAPAPNDKFTIVSASSVIGTFAGLPEGATAQFNGRTIRINYTSTSVLLSAVPVTLASVAINGGNPQRSRVTSITATFDALVTFVGDPAAAFQVEQLGVPSTQVGLTATVFNTTHTQVVLTFSGSNTEFGSLVDGNYRLKILAAQIGGTGLDGNGDGLAGDNPPELAFHRLFGDGNGDRAVTATDFAAFRLDYGLMNRPTFDFNGDGFVGAGDFVVFRLNYGVVLLP